MSCRLHQTRKCLAADDLGKQSRPRCTLCCRAMSFKDRMEASVRTQPGHTALTLMPLGPKFLCPGFGQTDNRMLGGHIGAEHGFGDPAPDRGRIDNARAT